MYTSQLNNFKECFPKNHRPEISELEVFWNNGVEDLFRDFAEYILQHYDLRFGVPVWSEMRGWTYRIGKSWVYLIKGIQIEKKGFIVGEILVDDHKSYTLALEYVKNLYQQCECEYQYSYKEYRRSFRRNNMPTGAAAKVFDEYMVKWNAAKVYSEKMFLIDTLLHEFHLSLVSGAVHRPVAMNFIDGTRRQVEEVISELARGHE